MGLPRSNDGEARFSAYVEGLTSVIGHADRAKPLRDYCLGLMMSCERKSVEPKAQPGLGQGACVGPAKACLAHDHMAGSYRGGVVLAICPCARSCRASGLLARRQSAGGVAVD